MEIQFRLTMFRANRQVCKSFEALQFVDYGGSVGRMVGKRSGLQFS